jgi:hypothetical protein
MLAAKKREDRKVAISAVLLNGWVDRPRVELSTKIAKKALSLFL